MLAKGIFWASLGALAWTHAGYPLAVAVAARVRPRPVRKGDDVPSVSVIVAAHDEEAVIGPRLENLLVLDYPRDRLEVVVASDGSRDATDAIVEEIAARDPRVRLVRCPRAGKVAAQNRAVRATSGEIVAFSDANATWAPDALRKLVRNFADPDVAYVCGQLRLLAADGTNREGLYWRYELWLREHESRLGSITGGNGSIYAVRREDYVELDGKLGHGHDLVFPYRMVQRGRRAVYEPEAVSFEKPSRDVEDEYARRQRMFRQSWRVVLHGRMLRGQPPFYSLQLLSHRHARYASGLLHALLLATSVLLARRGRVYDVVLATQVAWLAAAALARLRVRVPGAGLAYYYLAITWGTVSGLVGYLRAGAPAVWGKAEGTR